MNTQTITNGFFKSSFSGVQPSNLFFQNRPSQIFRDSSFSQNQTKHKDKKEKIKQTQKQQQNIIVEKLRNKNVINSTLFPKRITTKQKPINNFRSHDLKTKGMWKTTTPNKINDHSFLRKIEKKKQSKKEHFFEFQKKTFHRNWQSKNKNGNNKENINMNINSNKKNNFDEIKMETETTNVTKHQNHLLKSELNQMTKQKQPLFHYVSNISHNNNDNKMYNNTNNNNNTNTNNNNNNNNININNINVNNNKNKYNNTCFKSEKTKETAKKKKDKIKKILNNLNSSNCPYSNQEYLTEQFESYLKREKHYQADPFYLNRQQFTEIERIEIINWLSLICEEYELQQETFLIAINIFERYLSLYDDFPLQLLKVLGVVSLFIASKVEEIYSLTISDLINIMDDKIKKQTLLKFEMSIFNSLKFRTSPVTTHNWLQLFVQKLIWEEPNLLPQDLKEIFVSKCEFDPNEKIKNKKNQEKDNYDNENGNLDENDHKNNHLHKHNFNSNHNLDHSLNQNHKNKTKNNNNNKNEKKHFNDYSHFDKITNQMNDANNNILTKNKKRDFSTFNLFQNSNSNFKINKRDNIKNYNKIMFNNKSHNSNSNINRNYNFKIDVFEKRNPKKQFENFPNCKPDLKNKRFEKKNNQILNFIQFEQQRKSEKETQKINNSFYQLRNHDQQLIDIDNQNLPKFSSGKIVNQTKTFNSNKQFSIYENNQENSNNNNDDDDNDDDDQSNNKMEIESNIGSSNKYKFNSKAQSKVKNKKSKQINQTKQTFEKEGGHKGEEKEEKHKEQEEIIYELFNRNNSKKNSYPLNFNSFRQKNKPKKICQIKKINKYGSYNQIIYKIKEYPKKIFFQFSQLLTVLIMDPTSLQFLPSQIAASIFYLYFEKDFNNITQRITFYSKNQLQNCIDWIKIYRSFLFETNSGCSLSSYDNNDDDVVVDNGDDEVKILKNGSYNLHFHNDQFQKFVTNLFQNLTDFLSKNVFN
ncbi:g1/s-specific cyclin-e1 [Anaeramoeba flamelloides]|uniref:G1/s-specific cyclin-e1 n=1 Tax=Anaeramoeba flamelloides TaxID=1746091 RepID=A0AAV7YNE6_9EUKA|nr:g1/s-specific cyclin-e1 [Anaeramoeba flamelloides]